MSAFSRRSQAWQDVERVLRVELFAPEPAQVERMWAGIVREIEAPTPGERVQPREHGFSTDSGNGRHLDCSAGQAADDRAAPVLGAPDEPRRTDSTPVVARHDSGVPLRLSHGRRQEEAAGRPSRRVR